MQLVYVAAMIPVVCSTTGSQVSTRSGHRTGSSWRNNTTAKYGTSEATSWLSVNGGNVTARPRTANSNSLRITTSSGGRRGIHEDEATRPAIVARASGGRSGLPLAQTLLTFPARPAAVARLLLDDGAGLTQLDVELRRVRPIVFDEL